MSAVSEDTLNRVMVGEYDSQQCTNKQNDVTDWDYDFIKLPIDCYVYFTDK